LSEGDVQLPKLFRQTAPQRWPGGGKTAVTELSQRSYFVDFSTARLTQFSVAVVLTSINALTD